MASRAASAESEVVRLCPYTSRRTEAMPKHSLFGSELQHFEKDEFDKMRSYDLKALKQEEMKQRKEYRQRRQCATQLPAYLRKKVPDDELQYSKQELEDQVKKSGRAKKMLDLLEEKSKYFDVGICGDEAKPKPKPENVEEIQSGLKTVSHMNQVGLPPYHNYNHHRYGAKPPVHQYSIIGDPLNMGMDFPTQEPRTPTKAYFPVERAQPPASDRLPKEAFMKSESKEQNPKLAVDLPPNIQHQFGSRICASLLSDPEKVQDTMDKQKKLRDSQFRVRSEPQRVTNPTPENTDRHYKTLGHLLRQDIFPGYMGRGAKQSILRQDFTDDVFTRRPEVPDQYRYQRDQLSTWAEQNVLRDRVKKAWDARLQEAQTANQAAA